MKVRDLIDICEAHDLDDEVRVQWFHDTDPEAHYAEADIVDLRSEPNWLILTTGEDAG